MFLARKNTRFLINSDHKTASTIVSGFGTGGFFSAGDGYGVTIMMMEAVGNGESGRVEGF